MQVNNPWLNTVKKTVTPMKHVLSNLSIRVRSDQFRLFNKIFNISSKTKVLDVGVTSDETLKDSNIFEKLYQWPNKLTCATIEDPKKFKQLYPKVKIAKILSKKKLPFKNNEFDIAVSWATLEHVGDYIDQEFFINELLRIAKKVFITTPYRGCIYEPHSGLFFVHWLPLKIFRKICKILGKDFWTTSENLNPLFIKDIKHMKTNKKLNIKIYNMFGIIPSHIIITNI